MLVGIMSDSHGDAEMTRQAIALLESRGAKKLFHCGDLCGDGVLAALAGHDCAFVWGNCDEPGPLVRRYVHKLGLPWPEGPVRMELDRKQIALYHGHERGFRHAPTDDGLDYLFFGHTHQLADGQVGTCRVINPGALYRAAVHSVALVDLESDRLSFFEVETGEELRSRSRQ